MEELEQLKKDDHVLIENRELMCHFYICLNIYRGRGSVNSLKSWTDYLFPVLDSVLEDIQVPIADADISKMMASSGHGDIILEKDDGIY